MKARQKALLNKVGGLQQADSDSIARILEGFKLQFANMVAEYNALVDQSMRMDTQHPDTAKFLQKRDQLVQQTRDRLKQVLSADGMLKLDADVRGEKKNMRITSEEAGQ
jgi:hypothetical protein